MTEVLFYTCVIAWVAWMVLRARPAVDSPDRKSKRLLRRWCEHEQVHFDLSDDGPCAACVYGCDKCLEMSVCVHVPKKRRMLVCSECEQGYFNREAYDAHVCGDAG